MPKSTGANLAPLVEALIKRGGQAEEGELSKLAEAISLHLHVNADEVAILVLVRGGHFLRFVYPEKLQGVGTIPLTSTSALAARTARDKRSEINNNFVIARHASVFEAVPLDDKRAKPIQKIMSVPILLNSKVVGVLQASRKGMTQAAAGQDFTSAELNKLLEIAGQIAPCIQLLQVKEP
jgi:GAF domain-containing protein